MNLDLQKHKTKLEESLKRLEKEILTVSQKASDSTWEGIQTEVGEDTADRQDVAESIENYNDNSSITSEIEKEILDIKNALEKIDGGNYGTCEVCQAEIEEDRLEANPEAKTCKLHM